MPVKAILLDRDGVLVTVDRGKANSFIRALVPLSVDELGARWQAWGTTYGFPRTVDEEQSFWRSFWVQLSEELNLHETVRAQLLGFNYTTVLRAFPDARPALEDARRRGLRIGVLSNFSLATIEDSLMATGLNELVDVACAATVVGVAKPHPDAFRTVLALLEVAPSECIFVDDRRIHVDGALAIGIDAYLLDRKHSAHNVQERIICDLSGLAQILDARK